MPSPRSIPWTLLVLAAWPALLSGQSIRGRLVSSDDGRPVPNALVILHDSLDNQIARASTLATGTFAFHFVDRGTFRLRVLRIGFAPWRSGDIHMEKGVLDLDIELPIERVVLPDDIVVEGSSACRAEPESGMATALLIEEARKAFALAEETLTGHRMRFRVWSYLRRLDPDNRVLREQMAGNEPLATWPIRSAPVDSLAQWGFVRPPTRFQRNIGLGPTYFGPDGKVLFSSWFLGSHCFAISRDETDTALVGLAFRPGDGTTNPDIAGTLWIDESSMALLRLEFDFVRLPKWVPPASTGGQLQFSQLPGGGWVVSRWWMRAPIKGYDRTRAKLEGFQESGGSVVEVVDRDGNHLQYLNP